MDWRHQRDKERTIWTRIEMKWTRWKIPIMPAIAAMPAMPAMPATPVILIMIPPRTTAHAVPTIVRQTPWNAEKGHGTFRKTAVRVNTFGSIIMDKAMVFMEDVPDILTGKTCPWRISFCTSSVPVPTSSATEWAERQASREYWPCWRRGESSHSGSFRTCWECSQVPSARFSIR